MAKLNASDSSRMSGREIRNMRRAREIAAGGMVLLENKGVLPIPQEDPVALFGRGARYTVKGGTGSGDVNSRFVVSVEQGLEECGYSIASKAWLDRYTQTVENARKERYARMKEKFEKDGLSYERQLFDEPFALPEEIEITPGDINTEEAETAVYILSRNSGEGKDRTVACGDYELEEIEKKNIDILTENYKYVVVALNVGGPIDTKYFRENKKIGALLLMSQAGNITGYVLADVISGMVPPSGHLAATWAENYEDYPNAKTFSHMNNDVEDEYYHEGIYVGYRYFDTFNVKPAYPFGYGLTYTRFRVVPEAVKIENKNISVNAIVTNTGDYPGREVVQVYYSAPEGTIEKPYQELAGYEKTMMLQPTESCSVNISFPIESMASYDSSKAAYVLEAGTYYIRLGEHSRNTHIAAAVEIKNDIIVSEHKNLFAQDEQFDMLSSKGVSSYTYPQEEQEKEKAVKLSIDESSIGCTKMEYSGIPEELADKHPDIVITMDDVRSGRYTLEELTAQLTIEEMAQLCIGTFRENNEAQCLLGNESRVCPGAAGDTSSALIEKRNIRNMALADGPAGLRLYRSFLTDADGNYIPGSEAADMPEVAAMLPAEEKKKDAQGTVRRYQYCTAIPIATMLAQTFDVNVIEDAGDMVGEEMLEMGAALWLAPGMNIQRNPLCGRNFEYYSEDPLVAGKCAAADTKGVQKHPGVGTTIKHFACNNQEDNRNHSNSHVSERALREIYLKGFETAVKTSQPMALMTSYNLINGIHTANNHDLVTAMLRDEWGFKGVVMTDWFTTPSALFRTNRQLKYGDSVPSGCIKAGNDLIMPGCHNDEANLTAAVDNASADCPITKSELQRSTLRILRIIMLSSSYEDAQPYGRN